MEVQLAKNVMVIPSQYFIHLIMSYKHKIGKSESNNTRLSPTAFGITLHESLCDRTLFFSLWF